MSILESVTSDSCDWNARTGSQLFLPRASLLLRRCAGLSLWSPYGRRTDGRPFGRQNGRPSVRPNGRPCGRQCGRANGRPFGRPNGRPNSRPSNGCVQHLHLAPLCAKCQPTKRQARYSTEAQRGHKRQGPFRSIKRWMLSGCCAELPRNPWMLWILLELSLIHI